MYCRTCEVSAPYYVAYLSTINAESVWSSKTLSVETTWRHIQDNGRVCEVNMDPCFVKFELTRPVKSVNFCNNDLWYSYCAKLANYSTTWAFESYTEIRQKIATPSLNTLLLLSGFSEHRASLTILVSVETNLLTFGMHPNLFIKHATVKTQTYVFRRKNCTCEVKQVDEKCSQYETLFFRCFRKIPESDS
jgi:hypothetical protein